MRGKRVPKHVIRRLETMQSLMDRLVRLNVGLERWLEANGAEYGFEFTDDFRNSAGYSIPDIEGFVERIQTELLDGGERA